MEYEINPISTSPLTPTPAPAPKPPLLTLPLAIVIAGVLIAGSVMYSNVWAKNNLANTGQATGPKTGTIQYTLIDIKKWAKKVVPDAKAFNACLDSGKYAEAVKASGDQGATLGVQGTPSFFINGIFVEGAVPFANLQSIVDNELAKKTPKTTKRTTITVAPNEHIRGDINAPVIIVEYSDFQCPFCRMFFSQTLPDLLKTYVDTGKARLVYRQFPLFSIHPMAEKSAEATECASDQGKFWEMHDAIFTEQAK